MDFVTASKDLASSFLPPENRYVWNEGDVVAVEKSTPAKVTHCALEILRTTANFAKFAVTGIVTLPFYAARSIHAICYGKKEAPFVLPVSTAIDFANASPAKVGFSDSLYQTVGLGTKHSATKLDGVSNWDKWLDPKHIEGGEQDYNAFFTDVLSNPAPFIDILKSMGSNVYRFSLEWSVIETAPGVYNQEAIAVYKNFISQLQQAGIEPYMTLHHFVLPEWFEQLGGFEKLENTDLYAQHAINMMQEFSEVKNWMTFNEPGVYAFQSRMRGVYPPGLIGNVTAHGAVLRNLLVAHCKTYKAAQEAKADGTLGADVKIGITHQWLKFVPHSGNWVERMVCHFLSKLTHYVVYDFFKTGRFALDLPFASNIRFDVPEEEFEKNNRFIDFIGVQFYGFPQLKIGFNGGKEFPGTKQGNQSPEITNICIGNFGFTSGATCQEGGFVQSFGPGFFPESLDACLTEAAALNKPIAITETGCDAKIQRFGSKEWIVDDDAQKLYFQKIPSILAKFKEQMIALFVWTAVRHHDEWEHGNTGPVLGLITLEKDANRQITGSKLSSGAEFLQEAWLSKQQSSSVQSSVA